MSTMITNTTKMLLAMEVISSSSTQCGRTTSRTPVLTNNTITVCKEMARWATRATICTSSSGSSSNSTRTKWWATNSINTSKMKGLRHKIKTVKLRYRASSRWRPMELTSRSRPQMPSCSIRLMLLKTEQKWEIRWPPRSQWPLLKMGKELIAQTNENA